MTHILFLCIGNSCRSQMAEGFAKTYGKDVIVPCSAGLAPASIIAPLTRQTMLARNISLDDHFPKDITQVDLGRMDRIINMSGVKLPTKVGVPVEDWLIDDPIGQSPEVFERVAGEIETRVMRLILDLRKPPSADKGPAQKRGGFRFRGVRGPSPQK